MNVGTLTALLTVDHAKFDSGLKSAEGGMSGAAGRMGNVLKDFAKIGVAAFAAVVAGIGTIVGLSLKAAMAEQISNAMVTTAFGASAKTVQDWSMANQVALGATHDVLNTSLAQWAIYVKNIGLNQQQAIGTGEALAQRASDIAAVTGKSFEDVFTAMQKGVQGATRGLKAYGVVIDPVVQKQKALEMGLWSGHGALTMAAKAQVNYNLIMQQTAAIASGAALAHQNAAFQMKQFGVLTNQVFETLGNILLPIMGLLLKGLLPAFQAISAWVTDNAPAIKTTFQSVFGVVGAILDGIGKEVLPRLIVAFQTVVTWVKQNGPAIQNILKTAFDAVATAIGFLTNTLIPALVAGFTFIMKNIDFFGPAIAGVVIAFAAWAVATLAVAAANAVLDSTLLPVIAILAMIGIAVGALYVAWEHNFGGIRDIVGTVVNGIVYAFNTLKDAITAVIDAIKFMVKAVQDALAPLANSFSSIFGAITGVVGGFASAAMSLLQPVIDLINRINSNASVLTAETANYKMVPGTGQFAGQMVPATSIAGGGTGPANKPSFIGGQQGSNLAMEQGLAPTPKPKSKPKAAAPSDIMPGGNVAPYVKAANAGGAASKAAAAANAALASSYTDLKTKALSFFSQVHTAALKQIQDTRTQANATIDAQIAGLGEKVQAAQAAITAQQNKEQLAQLQDAIANATDPASLAAAQQALSDYQAQQALTMLTDQTNVQIASLNLQKTANDTKAADATTAENTRYTDQVSAFNTEFTALDAHLKATKTKYGTANTVLLAMLKSFGVDYASTGAGLGQKFGAGLTGAIATAVASASAAAAKLVGSTGAPPTATLPHFASGTPSFTGGLALVGEKGPELVNLPGGAGVASAEKTAGMGKGVGTSGFSIALALVAASLSQAGMITINALSGFTAAVNLASAALKAGKNGPGGLGSVTFGNIIISGVNDPDAIARIIVHPLRRELTRQGMSLA